MSSHPPACPSCGGPLGWEEAAGHGYLHTSECPAPGSAGAIPVTIQVGDADPVQIGAFTVEDGESTSDNLITFLHATVMVLLKKQGRNPAMHCTGPARKSAGWN